MMHWNPAQLATLAQARDLAQLLTRGPVLVGDGVAPETDDNDRSGIYVPTWLPGPAGFPQPEDVDPETQEPRRFFHLRFANGAEGVNVGLVLDRLRRYPMAQGYVLWHLQNEVAQLARDMPRSRWET